MTGRGSGAGGRLYRALESLLAEMGILNLNACIAVALKEDEYLTNASVDFHKHLVISVWESSTDAAISLTVGIIWYGWKR